MDRTIPPFVIKPSPAADERIAEAVRTFYHQGNIDLIAWVREHDDYLLKTYEFSVDARGLYDFEYLWCVILSWVAVRIFEEDDPAAFASPHLAFPLAGEQLMSTHELYAFHVTCYAYAISAPIRFKEGEITAVAHVHGLIFDTSAKLGELLLGSNVSLCQLNNTDTGKQIIREATTNGRRWLANIVDAAMRYMYWQPGL